MRTIRFIQIFIIIATIPFACYESFDGKQLGNGYALSFYKKYTLMIRHPDYGIVVGNTVLDFAYDSLFILASQRPWVDSVIPGVESMQTLKEMYAAFEASTFKYYWIINKMEKCERIGSVSFPVNWMGDDYSRILYSNVYGPYQREEYLRKREELGVPRELALKEDTIP